MSEQPPDDPSGDAREVLVDVRCTCGQKLVDAVTRPDVVVGDEAIPFRRTTDYLVCPACRSMYRVTDVGSDLVVGGAVVTEVRDDR